MDLFDHAERQRTDKEAPLAARMRPRTLDEFVGQEHIMAPGRLLRRAIEADRLASLIFYGPPGTGKTTLAEVIARRTEANFTALNAVLAGVKDIREAIEEARRRRGQFGQPTVLFIDEVHRFNKAQQDALLPWVEKGTVILVGATTENPYFEVNKALVSRSRIFQLRPLEARHLHQVLDAALADRDRGYGAFDVELDADARDHLVNVANGDARSLLGALELAVETTPPRPDGLIRITLAVAEESIQQRAVLYDKEGDAHFDTISAFIKSLRGSDPDASLYWLARMVYAGEDPRFVFRRLVIFASEDVGLAQPEAVAIVNACASAFDRVGLPEGRFHLAQATLYLATARKSNSTMGFFDALNAIKQEREVDVPNHLKDGTRDKEGFGHGKGYMYPHAYRDHWVAQQYLPGDLQGRVFYNPSDQGYEADVHDEVHRRRDAQIAAMVERDSHGLAPEQILTASPNDPELDRWLQRTMGDVGAQLGGLRDRVIEAARLRRHHVVLDLHAGTGLLTWEAARRTPEGGVYARCADPRDAQAIEQRALAIDPLRRPVPFAGDLAALPALLHALSPGLTFDAIVGRNALVTLPDKARVLELLPTLLRPTGRLVLLEGWPQRTHRLYDLVPSHAVPAELRAAWVEAEETIYANKDAPMLNWTPETLAAPLRDAGLAVALDELGWTTQRRITRGQLDAWFSHRTPGPEQRPDYASQLRTHLSASEVATVEATLRKLLTGELVGWHSAAVLLVAERPA